jgi:predicted nucleic acid-binding protein
LSLAIVDTNILVYAYDPKEPSKHQRAVDLIEELSGRQELVVTAQILNELAWVLLRKRQLSGATPELISQIVAEVAGSSQVLPLISDFTLSALTAVAEEGMSFWDALIWAAAVHHQIPTIFTEDFQHGRTVRGVQFLNPFV